jgi:hypothetical protein
MRIKEPMPKISKADLSRLAGFKDRSGVSQAIKRGALVADADGSIDTDYPQNAEWIAAHTGARKRKARATVARAPAPEKAEAAKAETPAAPATAPEPENPKTERKPKRPARPPRKPDDDLDAMNGIEKLIEASDEKLKYTRARRLQAEADTHLKDIRAAELKKRLIPRELVRQRFNAFDASLKTNFRDMPRRISAQLHALAVSEGPAALEAALEREVGAALARAKDEAGKMEMN